MVEKLVNIGDSMVVIVGMFLIGRNIDFYWSLVIECVCFFGNLYGMKYVFVEWIREILFCFFVGFNWIDFFLIKVVNMDLKFIDFNLFDCIIWIEGVGYDFEKLLVFKCSDIKLYINCIVWYELGKI